MTCWRKGRSPEIFGLKPIATKSGIKIPVTWWRKQNQFAKYCGLKTSGRVESIQYVNQMLQAGENQFPKPCGLVVWRSSSVDSVQITIQKCCYASLSDIFALTEKPMLLHHFSHCQAICLIPIKWIINSWDVRSGSLDQWRTEGGLGCSNDPPRNYEGPQKSCQTQPDLWKLLKIAEFRTPTPQDVREKGSKILKLPMFAVVLH